MIRLGVNVDHVATLRQARGEPYPDPVQAAVFAELGGADNITAHLREDRRHIQDRDLRLLKDTIKIPLNFEMADTQEMIRIAKEIRPEFVTLVPEKREERTTEGGLNLKTSKTLGKSIETLKSNDILVSLFIEPNEKTAKEASKLGADAVEFHTGRWCHKMLKAHSTAQKAALIRELQTASKASYELGLQVHFGHGLNYSNAFWLQHVVEAEEANIGHAIIARAVFTGLKEAVQEMKSLLNDAKFKPFLKH